VFAYFTSFSSNQTLRGSRGFDRDFQGLKLIVINKTNSIKNKVKIITEDFMALLLSTVSVKDLLNGANLFLLN